MLAGWLASPQETGGAPTGREVRIDLSIDVFQHMSHASLLPLIPLSAIWGASFISVHVAVPALRRLRSSKAVQHG